jgi:hypothetical protein
MTYIFKLNFNKRLFQNLFPTLFTNIMPRPKNVDNYQYKSMPERLSQEFIAPKSCPKELIYNFNIR